MCFSAPVSFATFGIEMLIAMYLWNRNFIYDRMNALFILTFALIQLWEGAIWNDKRSSFIIVILLSLWLQPLIQCYGAYYETKKWFFIPLIILYIITFLYACFRVTESRETWDSIVGKNGHLIWKTSSNSNSFLSSGLPFLTILYLFGLLFPLFYTQQWLLLFVGLLTLGYSWFNYRTTGETSSMWCYLGIIYAIVAILFPKIEKTTFGN